MAVNLCLVFLFVGEWRKRWCQKSSSDVTRISSVQVWKYYLCTVDRCCVNNSVVESKPPSQGLMTEWPWAFLLDLLVCLSVGLYICLWILTLPVTWDLLKVLFSYLLSTFFGFLHQALLGDIISDYLLTLTQLPWQRHGVFLDHTPPSFFGGKKSTNVQDCEENWLVVVAGNIQLLFMINEGSELFNWCTGIWIEW